MRIIRCASCRAIMSVPRYRSWRSDVSAADARFKRDFGASSCGRDRGPGSIHSLGPPRLWPSRRLVSREAFLAPDIYRPPGSDRRHGLGGHRTTPKAAVVAGPTQIPGRTRDAVQRPAVIPGTARKGLSSRCFRPRRVRFRCHPNPKPRPARRTAVVPLYLA